MNWNGIRAIWKGAGSVDRALLTFDNANHNAGAPIPAPVFMLMSPVSPGKADSDAGDSGWSSREGLSSLESSMDEDTRASSRGAGDAGTIASSLAPSISQDTAMTRVSSTGGSEASSIQMTYSELDQGMYETGKQHLEVWSVLVTHTLISPHLQLFKREIGPPSVLLPHC